MEVSPPGRGWRSLHGEAGDGDVGRGEGGTRRPRGRGGGGDEAARSPTQAPSSSAQPTSHWAQSLLLGPVQVLQDSSQAGRQSGRCWRARAPPPARGCVSQRWGVRARWAGANTGNGPKDPSRAPTHFPTESRAPVIPSAPQGSPHLSVVPPYKRGLPGTFCSSLAGGPRCAPTPQPGQRRAAATPTAGGQGSCARKRC